MTTLSQSRIPPRAAPARRDRWKPAEVTDDLRTVRIGLLGLGRVGTAVARTCLQTAPVAARRGLRLVVSAALVRDARGRLPLDDCTRVTSDVDDFFRQPIDVVVEVLGGVEPATRLVEAALRRGLPVVTANKALLGAHGRRLFELADALELPLRCEASVVAGVPFLANLRARPFAARVQRVAAVLNGTSNFILTRIERNGIALETALAAAQARGLAEPDASRDVDGADAADKLALLLLHLGVLDARPELIETTGIAGLEPLDCAAARRFGFAIRPLACAQIDGARVAAFVGPGLVPLEHGLARVVDETNGVELRGPEIGAVFYSGPGAGPDVTAATILDDVIEIASASGGQGGRTRTPSDRIAPRAISGEADRDACGGHGARIDAPATGWFVRIRNATRVDTTALRATLAARGVSVRATGLLVADPAGSSIHVLTHACRRECLENALAALRASIGGTTLALRCLEDPA